MDTKAVPTPEPLIQVSNLTKTYNNGAGPIEVLRRVDLEVHLGEMVAVMGPSGSGKSSLLYILGLLQAPSSGSYYWENINLLSLDRGQQAESKIVSASPQAGKPGQGEKAHGAGQN